MQVGAQLGDEAGQATGRNMLSTLGGAMKAGIGAVAATGAVLFTAAFGQALEQSASKAKLAAQLGLGPKESAQLGKAAGSIYAQGYGESIDQVNESLRTLTQNGILAVGAPRKDVDALTKSALNLATAFDADVGDAAKAAGQLVRTGLVKDSREAFDLITVGFQKGGDKAGDLLDTLNEYPTQFRDLGLSAGQALGLLTQGLNAGARDSDLVADALKEFAIRSKDGSTTSAEGFKALGLSGDAMTAVFAKGGPQAAAGLDQVLDRLRAVPDPAKRSQIAVALFGTQAEDLQQALFALDPSTATAAIGQVAGAADRMGTALSSGAGQSIEVFKRQVLQGLSDFITTHILPALVQFGGFLNTNVLPVLREAGRVFMTDVAPALVTVANAFMGGVRWVQEYGAWLLPLGIAVAGLTITLNASAIATAAMTAVFSIYRGVILAASAVTRGYAIVQGVLNAVMNANPIGLIITGIAALVALLVVAYNKSDSFRAIVQATWAGIQAGWSILWNSFLKPGFDGLMVGLNAIGSAAMWLWSTVLQPVFSFIGAAARILAAIVLTILITPIYLAVKLLGAIFGWLWDVAIKPIWDLIAAGAIWLWTNGIKPAFDNIMVQIHNVAAVLSWLWDVVVQPVFGWIAGFIQETWGRIKLVWDILVAYVELVLVPLFMNFWNSTIKPVWEGIKSAINAAWESGIKPAFELLKRGVDNVKDSFHNGITAIGLIWDSLKDITRKPVQFVIDTVYNNGIRKVWNTIADFVHVDTLDPIKFASGGRTYGGIPGRDSIPALMMADEYVIRRDSARKLGFGTLDYINRNGTLPGFAEGGPVQRFKDGGVVGWIKGAASSVGDFFGDMTDLITNPGKAWQSATGFIRDKIASIAGSGYGKLIAGVPTKILSSLKDKVVSLIGSFGSSDVGGSGVQRWAPVVLQALSMLGQPASLLQTTLRRMNQESGGNPYAINNWDSNAMAGDPSRGLMQTIGSTFNAYAGPLRSRGIYDPLANIYASMRYALDRYGSIARAYNQPGGYDSGGWLMPGVTPVVNGTGRPEAVLTGSQWEVARAALASGGAGDQRQYHITLQGSQMTSAEQAAELVRQMRFVA
ncbi:phage tail tape measure protein [Streptomyces sp. A1136]|uniref:phage tail tape measure protein n=1 Tax=Streptomyces sp. A1136 TaxID=2563102 RepID=UPI0019D031E2|nr:phage tail tape measure protein [Streptomyces sp. A1136]